MSSHLRAANSERDKMEDKLVKEYSFGREARKVMNSQIAYEKKMKKINLIITQVKTEISQLPETNFYRIKISEIITCAERDLKEDKITSAINDLETSENLLNLHKRAQNG